MSTAMLKASDVAFSWPSKRVLDGFSLTVEPGQVLCLMGPNGCGKSTFLECALGYHRLESGTILVEGHDISKMNARELARCMAYVPQVHESTFPFLVEHMVGMGRTAYRTGLSGSNADDAQRVQAAMELCGIAHLHGRVCTELSGGEMQMTLLARALVQEAPLIVLDEPTNHLDFHNELLFLETVERLSRESGVTILMATHAPNQAFHMAAEGLDVKVALMDGGRVAAFGDPSEVLTEESFARYFSVAAQVVTNQLDSREGMPADRADWTEMSQVVPLHTCPRPNEEDR